jgi:hypothetical protein
MLEGVEKKLPSRNHAGDEPSPTSTTLLGISLEHVTLIAAGHREVEPIPT